MKFARPDLQVRESVIEATVTLTISGSQVAIVDACAADAGKSVDVFLSELLAGAVDRLKKPRRLAVSVPAWVPAGLRDDYLEVAKQDGEEAAAAWARREKRRLPS